MVRLIACLLLAACAAGGAQARVLKARIARVSSPVATLQGVGVRVDWPAGADQGTLHLRAARVDAPEMGYRFRDLDWSCPLRRDGQGGWRCEGMLRSGRGAPFRLGLQLGTTRTRVNLSRGASRIALDRDAAAPDISRIDLTAVPLAWTQALLSKAWPDGRITGGVFDGRLTLNAAANRPLRITGPLSVRAAGFDTPDGTVAAEGVGARVDMDVALGDASSIAVQGQLLGGEMLFGSAYVSLQQRPVDVRVQATQSGDAGWRLPVLVWRDGGILRAEGRMTLTPDAELDDLDIRLRSDDLGPLRDAYLSGWLGLAGVPELQLDGKADVRLQADAGEVRDVDMVFDHVTIADPNQRFGFERLHGDLRFSSGAPRESALQWDSGVLYGLQFGSARLPLVSNQGELRFREAMAVPMLGGTVRFDHMELRPPGQGQGLDVRFGMELDRLDVAQLATALEWPPFTGELSGSIPQAHYAAERLDFDGGLRMQVFDGDVTVSKLSMERPFGVAPTLSADIAMDDLDMERLTGVFGFGAITGRMDGRIGGLRMVDWQAVAFDAKLQSDRKASRRHRSRQRISQRAVQDLSSVGDASFVTSLQSRLIGLFDDFGYSRLGISCRLADDVCQMDGLGSAGRGFIIVEGSGLPRLSVIGYNHRVDWPTLLERLGAIGQGDSKPIVE